MPENSEPNSDEIINLRQSTLEQLETDGTLESLDQIDIKRFKNDDSYVKRFLMHHHNKKDLAQKMAIDTLKWRKEQDVNYITEDSLNIKDIDNGALFAHNRDKDGCKMLQFCIRKHKIVPQDKLKKILIYWIERLEREEKGKWLTFVFDMQETGIRHMDMDLIKFVVNLFKFYYPYILNYILVIDMPWILNAIWKIIKSWLPPEAIEKIKFVDKKQLLNYVPIDQCILEWGGTDQIGFNYIPEEKTFTSEMQELSTFDHRNVHFCDSSSSRESSIKHNGTILQTESGDLSVEVIPPEELVFHTNRAGSIATITIRNCGNNCITYKLKTTAPDKYKVRPSIGTVMKNDKAEIVITLYETLSTLVLVKDKFLIMVTATPDGDNCVSDGQIFKTAAPEDIFEVKLRIGLQNPDLLPTDNKDNGTHNETVIMLTTLTDKLNGIMLKQVDLQQEANNSRRLMIIALFSMFAILIFIIITTNNMTALLHKASMYHATNTPDDL